MLPRKMKAIMIAGITSHSVNLSVNRFIQRAEMGNVHVSGEMERVRVSYACHTQHEQVASYDPLFVSTKL